MHKYSGQYYLWFQTFTGRSWNIFTADNRGTTVFELFLQVGKTPEGQKSFFVLFCFVCYASLILHVVHRHRVCPDAFGYHLYSIENLVEEPKSQSHPALISYSIFLLLFLHDAVDSKSNPVNSLGFQFSKFPKWGYELINCGFERVEL